MYALSKIETDELSLEQILLYANPKYQPAEIRYYITQCLKANEKIRKNNNHGKLPKSIPSLSRFILKLSNSFLK